MRNEEATEDQAAGGGAIFAFSKKNCGRAEQNLYQGLTSNVERYRPAEAEETEMTTIPEHPDGSPDWEKMSFPRLNVYLLLQDGFLGERIGLTKDVAKQLYITALKRCLEWHETQANTSYDLAEKTTDETLRAHLLRVQENHYVAANTIRRWIEGEEKKK